MKLRREAVLKRLSAIWPLVPREYLGSFHFWFTLLLTAAILLLYYKWKQWFPWFWWYFVFVDFANKIIGFTLFLIPFIYASLTLWWRGPIIISVIYVLAISPLIVSWYSSLASIIRNIAFLFLPIAIAIIIGLELNWRKTLNGITSEREKERQRYMAQILQSQEEVRRRIALELHDDAIQRSLAIANSGQQIISGIDYESIDDIKQGITWMKDNAVDLTNELRRIALDLRPNILDNFGLVAAVSWLVSRLNEESEIIAHISVKGEEIKLKSGIEANIFRIVQEALNNIRQHSGASRAAVTLEYEADSLKVAVKDNGRGFQMSREGGDFLASGKLGLAGMRERIESIGGTFNIYSQVSRGTTIVIILKETAAGLLKATFSETFSAEDRPGVAPSI